MTAPLYRVDPGSLANRGVGDVVVLDGDEGHHAATVKRARPGEEILLADGGPRVARTTVVEAGAGRLDLRVEGFEDAARTGPRFVLVQALAKGDRDLQAVESATELGVDEVVPWQAPRSIVRWKAERAAKAHAKWVSTVTAAAKQCRRPDVPDVAALADSRALVARTRETVEAGGRVFVLHEDATTPLAGVDLPADGDVVLVVGPEGGIGADEVGELVAAGAVPARLGPYVLRASGAGPAAIAVLSARSRWA